MPDRRITFSVLFLIGLLLFVFAGQYLLVQQNVRMAEQQLDFRSQNILAETFYRIPIDGPGIQLLAEKLLERYRRTSGKIDARAVLDELRLVFRGYAGIGSRFQAALMREGISIPFRFAVVLSKFILRDRDREVMDLVRSIPPDAGVLLFGNGSWHEKKHFSSAFFHMGKNYYTEIKITVVYSHMRSFLLRSMKMEILLMSLGLLLIVAVLGFIMHTLIRQKQLSRMKSDFIGAISHELSTPISTIAVAASHLLQPGDSVPSDRIAELARIIRRQNNRLQRMLENVMNVTFLERGVSDISPVLKSFHELLTEIIADFRLQHEGEKVTVKEQWHAARENVNIDIEMMTTVFTNILDNAVKHGSDAPEIAVVTRNRDAQIIVEIGDNGPGLDGSQRQRIFDKFYRGARSRGKGLGLGLYSARSIVVMHGGSIEVESRPGEGSRFRVILPLEEDTV